MKLIAHNKSLIKPLFFMRNIYIYIYITFLVNQRTKKIVKIL